MSLYGALPSIHIKSNPVVTIHEPNRATNQPRLFSHGFQPIGLILNLLDVPFIRRAPFGYNGCNAPHPLSQLPQFFNVQRLLNQVPFGKGNTVCAKPRSRFSTGASPSITIELRRHIFSPLSVPRLAAQAWQMP